MAACHPSMGQTREAFARLFLVPGMNHCSGGSYALDSFDSLSAIVNWVEQGTAPDSMTAGNSFNQTFEPPFRVARCLQAGPALCVLIRNMLSTKVQETVKML